MPYLTENKYPLSSKVTLCQSLGRHHAHLLVQEPDKYMIGATIDMAHKTVLWKVNKPSDTVIWHLILPPWSAIHLYVTEV